MLWEKLKDTFGSFTALSVTFGVILGAALWFQSSNAFPERVKLSVQIPAPAPSTALPVNKISYHIFVKDQKHEPIHQAFISLPNHPELHWFTSKDGRVTLRIPSQIRTVTIVASGYITQTFQLPSTQGIEEMSVSYQLKVNPMLNSD